MNIESAIKFAFDDPRWSTKLGIGALLSLLSIFILPGFMLMGYGLEVARRVRNGEKELLPEWDFGQTLRDGFVVAVAAFIYALPILVLLLLAGIATGLFGALGGENAAATVGVLSFVIVGCLAFLYALAMIAIAPAIYVQYIRHGSLQACLDYRQVIELTRNNLGDILIIVLVLFGLGIALSFVFGILNFIPCLGQIAAVILSLAVSPWLSAVAGHLYGQLAAKIDGDKLTQLIGNDHLL